MSVADHQRGDGEPLGGARWGGDDVGPVADRHPPGADPLHPQDRRFHRIRRYLESNAGGARTLFRPAPTHFGIFIHSI